MFLPNVTNFNYEQLPSIFKKQLRNEKTKKLKRSLQTHVNDLKENKLFYHHVLSLIFLSLENLPLKRL